VALSAPITSKSKRKRGPCAGLDPWPLFTLTSPGLRASRRSQARRALVAVARRALDGSNAFLADRRRFHKHRLACLAPREQRERWADVSGSGGASARPNRASLTNGGRPAEKRGAAIRCEVAAPLRGPGPGGGLGRDFFERHEREAALEQVPVVPFAQPAGVIARPPLAPSARVSANPLAVSVQALAEPSAWPGPPLCRSCRPSKRARSFEI
jgi:hypothetical protein